MAATQGCESRFARLLDFQREAGSLDFMGNFSIIKCLQLIQHFLKHGLDH